jgi:GrpB-like predicted nucleotidyltransferase (UPF0157 family)
MTLVVVAPNPAWRDHFRLEAERLRAALGSLVADVHHIGSTAIDGIVAKPVVDMLLVVHALARLDAQSPQLVQLGYEVKGEFGIPTRRYFRKDSPPGVRTFQLHAYEVHSAHVERHVAFRDYMNAHPDAAQAYGLLKARLAAAHAHDANAYMDGKDAFIKAHEQTALAWRRAVG